MSVVNLAYTTTAAITITLTNLTNAGVRESTAVVNSANLYLDAIVGLQLAISNGTVAGDKVAFVYFYGSVDGVNYTDNATGTDAALTMRSPTNLRGPFPCAMPANGPLTYYYTIGSVAQYFGGVLPTKWGVVVQNTSGVVFATTGMSIFYAGITETVV